MIFQWYLIFNLADFLKTNLVSRTVNAQMEGIGVQKILITRGNEISIIYQNLILPIGFSGDNPFTREEGEKTYGIYKDSDENIWLGIEKES